MSNLNKNTIFCVHSLLNNKKANNLSIRKPRTLTFGKTTGSFLACIVPQILHVFGI